MGAAPGVSVLLPETRLVGLPVKGIPSTVYVDKVTVVEGDPSLLVEPGAGVLVGVCCDKAVSVLLTATKLPDGPWEKV